jgi:tetratricopeptide (TPR) repeat protein
VVFVAGPSGSGRSALLRGIGRRLEKDGRLPDVVAGRVVDGGYVPIEPARGHSGRAGDAAVALGGAAAMASAEPIAQLAAQVVRLAGAAVKGMTPDPATIAAMDFERLCSLLRTVVRERPLVCLIDDCDDADGRWWSELLLGLANEIVTDLPLFIFLTVDSDEPSPDRFPPGAPDPLLTAQILAAKDQAHWWPLAPVEPESLQAVMGPAEPVVLNRIRDLAEGRPSWAAELWVDWIEAGAIERDTDLDPWHLAPGDPLMAGRALTAVVRDRLLRSCNGDRDLAGEVQEILACGALQGRSFVADAVAVALGRDRDRVIDLLDTYAIVDEEHPQGLVEEGGFVSVTGRDGVRRDLWRYSFPSPLVGIAALRNVAGEGRSRALSAALLASLEHLYGAETRRIALQLARLCIRADRPSAAREWRRVAEGNMPDGLLVDMAQRLASQDPEQLLPAERARSLGILLAAASAVVDRGSRDDAYTLAGRAATFARAAKAVEGEGHALFLQGHAARSTDLSRSHFERSRALFASIGELSGTAAACCGLAWTDALDERHSSAMEFADEALAIQRRLKSPMGELQVEILRTNLDLTRDDLASAQRTVSRARGLRQHAGLEEAAALADVEGTLALQLDELAAARSQFEVAADLYRALGDLRDEMGALRDLGRVCLELVLDGAAGEYAQARATLERALALAEVLEEQDDELTVRQALAQLLSEHGEHREAVEHLRQVKESYLRQGSDGWKYAAIDLSQALDAGGLADAACAELEAVWDASSESDEWGIAWPALLGLIGIYWNRERFDAAESVLTSRLGILRRAPDEIRAAARKELGEALLLQDRFSDARRELRIAEELWARAGDVEQRDGTRELLARVNQLEDSGRPVRDQLRITLRLNSIRR